MTNNDTLADTVAMLDKRLGEAAFYTGPLGFKCHRDRMENVTSRYKFTPPDNEEVWAMLVQSIGQCITKALTASQDIEARLRATEWQPIETTQPKVDGDYLVLIWDDLDPGVDTWDGNDWKHFGNIVAYWMPLPKPPHITDTTAEGE